MKTHPRCLEKTGGATRGEAAKQTTHYERDVRGGKIREKLWDGDDDCRKEK